MKIILLLLAVFAASQAHAHCNSCSGPSTLPSAPGCGLRPTNLIDYRTKFASQECEANFGEFPWVAAILKNGFYHCAGTLIHPQIVLTAAHCVGSSTDYIVRLGEWNLDNTQEPLAHQDKKIIKTVSHSDFRNDTAHHDFALLFLESPVINAGNAKTICLTESSNVAIGSRCIVAGWGKSASGQIGTYHSIMKKIDVPIVSRDTCQNNLRQTPRLGQLFNLHPSFMCAGGEAGIDACLGDGGGPLMCPDAQNPNLFTQVGIVTWGIGCGQANVPGVYSDVGYARDWINQQYAANVGLLAH